MAYIPTDDAGYLAPVFGYSDPHGTWSSLVDNDAEVYEAYNPGIESNMVSASSALARQFRFRWWGNLDQNQITVGVRATATSGGPHTVTMATSGADSDTASVTTDGWYSTTLDARGPCQEVVISSAALGGGDTLQYDGVRASLSLSAPVAGTAYPSRYRKVGSFWQTESNPIPSEVQARLRNNAIYIAADRPACVFAHIADAAKAVSTKSWDVWGTDATLADDASIVGGGRVHISRYSGHRTYRVDAYTTDTSGGSEFAVRVGSAGEERWSGVGWHSWQVTLGPGQHTLSAFVRSDGVGAAAIRSLLVWRTEL